MSNAIHQSQVAPEAANAPTLGPVNDAFEREADLVADQVVNGAAPNIIQRFSTDEEENEELLQSKASGPRRPTAVPQAAAAVAAGGRPLGPSERAFFEPRFGKDLSSVRLHTDANAGAAANAIGARAYTLRNHIAFAPGQFDPSSRDGRRLMAHELTHTLQQGAVIRRDTPASARMPEGGNTVPATAQDRREFAQIAADFVEGQGQHFLLQQNANLGEQLDLLRPAAENGLSVIADDNAEAEATAIRTAYSTAVRNLIRHHSRSPAAGTTQDEAQERLYATHRSRILFFALPENRAAQGSTQLLEELNEPLPDRPTREQRARRRALNAARNNMQVQTADFQNNYTEYFNTQGGRTSRPLPEHTTEIFADNVAAGLRRGLRSVAADLAHDHFTDNMTIMLALDLTPYGGLNSSFRFTQIVLGPTSREIWIEHVSDIFREGLHPLQRAEMRERFGGFGFSRRGFSTSEFDEVLIGLSRIPDHHLSTLGDLTFRRESVSTETPNASAQYDEVDHQIEVFDRAFGSGLVVAGSGDSPVSQAAASIVHEVGHALDLLSIHQAGETRRAAEQALLAEFGTGGTGFSIPHPSDPDRARYDVLRGAITDATTAESAARSGSGARVRTVNNVREVVDGAGNSDFRRAVVADGGNVTTEAGFPTTYPDPESFWQEYFAESFMMYQTTPELLEQMRPHVFAFMQTQFPATPPATGATP